MSITKSIAIGAGIGFCAVAFMEAAILFPIAIGGTMMSLMEGEALSNMQPFYKDAFNTSIKYGVGGAAIGSLCGFAHAIKAKFSTLQPR